MPQIGNAVGGSGALHLGRLRLARPDLGELVTAAAAGAAGAAAVAPAVCGDRVAPDEGANGRAG